MATIPAPTQGLQIPVLAEVSKLRYVALQRLKVGKIRDIHLN